MVEHLAHMVKRYDAQALKRFAPPKRYARVACFLAETEKTRLDHVVEMNDQFLTTMSRHARHAFEVGQSIVIANQFAMKFNGLLNAVASLPIVFAEPSLNSEVAFYQILPRPPSSRGILSPPPLALLYDFAQIRNRPYLIRSHLHAWMLRDKLNGMIEASRLKDEKAGELFLGFRIGAVGRRDFAVFPVQGHGGLRRLKR